VITLPEPSTNDRPKTLAEAKAWMHDRLAKRFHPLGLTDPEETAQGIDALKGLDGANWAAEWLARGDRFFDRAEQLEASGKHAEARDAYYQAYGFYFLGRFPCPNHNAKLESYKRSLEAYQRFGRLQDPSLETVVLPFAGRGGEGTSITAYLRRPRGKLNHPVVLMWGGVDAWKEEMTALSDMLLRAGIATLAVDNVGTGQSPLKATRDGERQFLTLLDWIEQQAWHDGAIGVIGRSFGGHWATKLAHLVPERVTAAVNWGGGIHHMFQPGWITKSRHPDSYLMELVETRKRMLGAETEDEYVQGFAALSLLDQGLLDRPCAPLLLVNGKDDRQCPIEDIYLLLDHGSPKSVRLFPGGHMGFGPRTVPTIAGWLATQLDLGDRA
jgi:pimeloyl-ACP methyl ester carboxylesterase